MTDQAGNLGTGISGNSEDLVWYPFGVEYTNSGSWNDTIFGGMEPYQRNFGLNPTPNRLQSPLLGRWTTPDPLGGDVTDPQSLNRYAYVTNNPTTLADPLGLNPADNCSYASYYYSHARCGGPPTGCGQYDNGSCGGDPTCDNSFGLNGPNNCGNSPADVLGFPIGGSGGYGGIGTGGSAPGAPPAGQPPLRGGAGLDFRRVNVGPFRIMVPEEGDILLTLRITVWEAEHGLSPVGTFSPVPQNGLPPLLLPGTNYCGPGSRPGRPTSPVDALCQQHDNCYKRGGLSAESSGLSPAQQQAKAACDQQLCGGLQNVTAQGVTQTVNKGLINVFGCHAGLF